jgi:hypothetical protein
MIKHRWKKLKMSTVERNLMKLRIPTWENAKVCVKCGLRQHHLTARIHSNRKIHGTRYQRHDGTMVESNLMPPCVTIVVEPEKE